MADFIPAATMADFTDPELLAAIERLKIVARRVARGGFPAEQRSSDLGAGIEFRDYRPYAPGDDMRAIDWNIYRRLGRVVLRLFEELEDLPLYLLIDNSQSVFEEESPRLRQGLRCAFALASMALAHHDRVGLFTMAQDLETLLRPQSGRHRGLRFAQALCELKPNGATDLKQSLSSFERYRLRPGLCVVISDFFDPAGLEVLEASLARLRHRVLLVSLRRQSDANPDLQGELELVDCESGHASQVAIDGAVLQRYREAFARHEEGLRTMASRRGYGFLEIDVERPVVSQLASLFEGGAYQP